MYTYIHTCVYVSIYTHIYFLHLNRAVSYTVLLYLFGHGFFNSQDKKKLSELYSILVNSWQWFVERHRYRHGWTLSQVSVAAVGSAPHKKAVWLPAGPWLTLPQATHRSCWFYSLVFQHAMHFISKAVEIKRAMRSSRSHLSGLDIHATTFQKMRLKHLWFRVKFLFSTERFIVVVAIVICILGDTTQ